MQRSRTASTINCNTSSNRSTGSPASQYTINATCYNAITNQYLICAHNIYFLLFRQEILPIIFAEHVLTLQGIAYSREGNSLKPLSLLSRSSLEQQPVIDRIKRDKLLGFMLIAAAISFMGVWRASLVSSSIT
jgi:hypothetical protein